MERDTDAGLRDKADTDATASIDYTFKVVVIGDSGVGKSSLLGRALHHEFNPAIGSTVGIDFGSRVVRVELDVDGGEHGDVHNDNDDTKDETAPSQTGQRRRKLVKTVKLALWDTAGQEAFRALSSTFYRGAAGALVVYDVTSLVTANHVASWTADLEKHTMHSNEPPVIVLCGNKRDRAQLRQVTAESGRELARSVGASAFLETSAKERTNVDEMIDALASHLVHRQIQLSSCSHGALTEEMVRRRQASIVRVDSRPIAPAQEPSGGCCGS